MSTRWIARQSPPRSRFANAAVWPVAGPGREEISAVAAAPGGFVAGIALTAPARIDDAALPAPVGPSEGAAVIVRSHR
jgi:hypothetical protein